VMEERELDDLARELHAARAEPRAQYARELDSRAAEWLRERPRRRGLPSPRIAIPAAAAAALAAVVIALAVSGDDETTSQLGVSGGDEAASKLEVAVVPDRGQAEALGVPLDREPAARAAEGGFAAPANRHVGEGEPVTVRYFFTAPTRARVELAGRKTAVRVPEGAGRLEVSTEDLPAGEHQLELAVPGTPPYRERIEIGG
jgi:hypothetical protein